MKQYTESLGSSRNCTNVAVLNIAIKFLHYKSASWKKHNIFRIYFKIIFIW